ncbi:hypothetical protein IJI72_00005, partial [Candidatus Saccharibacteria bacterium]|nr:hypothetical protein [Candidatus Saccharibacteria bacterium]
DIFLFLPLSLLSPSSTKALSRLPSYYLSLYRLSSYHYSPLSLPRLSSYYLSPLPQVASLLSLYL